MREIKFRAWLNMENRMIDPVIGLDLSKPYQTIQWFDSPSDVLANNVCDCAMSECELMQYTGLKDKNDKEIYEGDIAKDGGTLYEILWVEKSAKFGAKVFKSKSVLCRGMTFPLQHYVAENTLYCVLEVIGNIYENPELLEVPHGET